MNTIKERTLFRGKLLDRADNYYPKELEGYYYKDFTDGKEVHYIHNPVAFRVEIDPKTLRQHTGLKDKYLKDIFSGDKIMDKNRNVYVAELGVYTKQLGNKAHTYVGYPPEIDDYKIIDGDCVLLDYVLLSEEEYIKSLDNDLKTIFPESDFKYGYDRLDYSHVFWFNKKTEKVDDFITGVLNDYYKHSFKSTIVFIDNNDPIGLT
jgi:hypothetical protein